MLSMTHTVLKYKFTLTKFNNFRQICISDTFIQWTVNKKMNFILIYNYMSLQTITANSVLTVMYK